MTQLRRTAKRGGQFDGGAITSDAAGLLLLEGEKGTEIVAQFAVRFRDPAWIEHAAMESVPTA